MNIVTSLLIIILQNLPGLETLYFKSLTQTRDYDIKAQPLAVSSGITPLTVFFNYSLKMYYTDATCAYLLQPYPLLDYLFLVGFIYFDRCSIIGNVPVTLNLTRNNPRLNKLGIDLNGASYFYNFCNVPEDQQEDFCKRYNTANEDKLKCSCHINLSWLGKLEVYLAKSC